MRHTIRCPKCSHREILKAPLIDRGKTGYTPAAVATVREKLLGGMYVDVHPVGSIDAYICRGCGYTELFVSDPSEIPDDADGVTVLRPDESDGPFRS